MRSKRLFGLAAAGLVLSAMTVGGCGDDDADGSGGSGNAGGNGGAGTGATGTGATGTGATGGGGGAGGGMTGDGNDSFAEAVDIGYDEQVDENLDPAGADADYFKFTGSAGDLILVVTDAKPSDDEFSDLYSDLVVTLYDANETKIAENDDPFLVRDSNDSELWTVLPADGEYFLRVTDCINWEGGGVDNCSPAENIEETGYAFIVANIGADPDVETILDAETGDDLASAADNDVQYVLDDPNTPGVYNFPIAYGGFNDDSDIDVYSLVMPADINVQNALSMSFLFAGPEGADGMGSTRNAGDVWITDDLGNVISFIDHQLGADEGPRDIRTRVNPSSQMYLFVEHPGDLPGGNDFYIAFHGVGDTNPLENQADPNDDINTPSILTSEPNNALHSAFLEGILDPADVDHFSIAVPAGVDDTWTIAVACGAERSGSGVRGLTVSLWDQAGTAVNYDDNNAAMGVESATEDLFLGPEFIDDPVIPVTAAMTSLVVKIEGNTPDPLVLSRFYQCGFHFVPPTP